MPLCISLRLTPCALNAMRFDLLRFRVYNAVWHNVPCHSMATLIARTENWKIVKREPRCIQSYHLPNVVLGDRTWTSSRLSFEMGLANHKYSTNLNN